MRRTPAFYFIIRYKVNNLTMHAHAHARVTEWGEAKLRFDVLMP